MLSIRARIFAVASIIILFILGISIILIVISRRDQPPEENGQNIDNTLSQDNFNQNSGLLSGGTAAPVISGAQIAPQTAEDMERNAVKQLAKIFIERYGSYSTDSDFQNIRDVQFLATDSLWQTISAQIGRSAGDGFVGVTTAVLSSEVTQMNTNSAQVSMTVAQEENKNGVTNNYSKTVLVYMQKVSGSWLVDKFEWQ